MSDDAEQLARLKAALAERYRVERELGHGGMATVYLAQDLKLDRQVALKVLRPDLAAALGSERFLREVRITARLNHPHILPLLDSGEADGVVYYTMPYVEGEPLRDRLEREKQLPLDDALQIAREVADALSYAHSHHVVHRDIKPENILLESGHAVVADFGIARAITAAGGERLTETGIAVGTPAYMSPEQAMGEKAIDARADIYAFGAVIYEMLTGEPPFTGATVQSILARVMSEEPRAIASVRKSVPPHVEAAVFKALAKLPADRWAGANDLAKALLGSVSRPIPQPAARRQPAVPRATIAWGGWTVAVVAAVVAVALARRHSTQPVAGRFNIILPDTAALVFVGNSPGGVGHTSLALSPDGTVLVYVGRAGKSTRLYVRRLDSDQVTALPGTGGAYSPFFKPDGGAVGFFAEAKLRKVSLAGGSAETLGPVNWPYGGVWLHDGRILVADAEGSMLLAFPEDGGSADTLFWSANTVRTPSLLGATGWIVGTARVGGPALLSIASGERLTVTPSGTLPVNSPRSGEMFEAGGVHYVDGHLVWTAEGRLYVAPFDAARRRLLGQATQTGDTVRQETLSEAPQFALSERGTAVYAPGAPVRISFLMKADRAGHVDTLPFPRVSYGSFRLSWTGDKIATTIIGDRRMELDLLDIRSGRKFLLAQTNSYLLDPVWSADGSSLGIRLWRYGTPGPNFLTRTYEVPGGAQADWPPDSGGIDGASRDGTMHGHRYGTDSLVIHMGGSKRRRLDPSGFWTEFSPDGRFVAWTAFTQGHFEILVARTEGDEAGTRIIPEGCLDARWAPDGSEIFCQGLDAFLYSVLISFDGNAIRAAPRRRVLPVPILDTPGHTWDLSPDGKYFYFVAAPVSDTTTVLTVVTDWLRGVTKRHAAASAAVEQ